MENPTIIAVGAAVYIVGAAVWIVLIGGITRPRRGRILMFIGDVLTTILWPIALVAWGVMKVTER